MPNRGIEQKTAGNPDAQTNDSHETSAQLTQLPDDALSFGVSPFLPVKETACLARVSRRFNSLFQPDIEKKKAKEAAEYSIYPTKENVLALEALLKVCPALLRHPVKTQNRHGMTIEGTVYQIAHHEMDNDLIDDVIKSAFNRLDNGLEIMEAQHKAWFPDGWLEREEKACEMALVAIDNVFIAFGNASDPHDMAELRDFPYTITINCYEANAALEVFRKAINALYEPKEAVITSGRDPNVRLLDEIINQYKKNFDALGGSNSPRNNAIMRSVFGYGQRFSPINFLQAFAQGVYFIVEKNEKLSRTLEFRNWRGHFIFPLDSDSGFRLGFDYFPAGGAWRRRAGGGVVSCGCYISFCQLKAATCSPGARCAAPNPTGS